MRVRKRHVKRFNKIIKTYYKKYFYGISSSMEIRSYPGMLISNRWKRRCKNHYKILDINNMSSFFSSYVSLPIYIHSNVKRSRVQHILSGYRMMSLGELNKEFNTDFTEGCIENICKIVEMKED